MWILVIQPEDKDLKAMFYVSIFMSVKCVYACFYVCEHMCRYAYLCVLVHAVAHV